MTTTLHLSDDEVGYLDKWATALEDVARSASLAAIDYGAWCWQLDRDRRASDSGGEAA